MDAGTVPIVAASLATGLVVLQLFKRLRGHRCPATAKRPSAELRPKQQQQQALQDNHTTVLESKDSLPPVRVVVAVDGTTKAVAPADHGAVASTQHEDEGVPAASLMSADAAVFTKHKLLDAGTLVYFLSMNGELVTVTQAGPVWMLQTMSLPVSEPGCGNGRRPGFIPPSSIFMVLRKRQKMGFRSLGAEGRNLQAVKGPTEPPRVTNYNFGSWESWMLIGERLVNCKWNNQVLPLIVHELRVLSVEDMWREELIRQQQQRHMLGQVEEVQRGRDHTEKRLQKLGLLNTELQQQQQDMERKMRELSKDREKLQRERDTFLRERDAAEHAAQGTAAAAEKLEARLRQNEQDRKTIQEHFEKERNAMLEHQDALKEAHHSQIQVLTAEMERLQEEGLMHSTHSARAESTVQRLEQQLEETIKQLTETQQEVDRRKLQYDCVAAKYDEASKVIRAISSSILAVDGSGNQVSIPNRAAQTVQRHCNGTEPLLSDRVNGGTSLQSNGHHKPAGGPQGACSPRLRTGVPPTPDLQQSLNPMMRSFFMSTEGSVNGSSLLGGGTPNTAALLDFLYPEGFTDDGLATPRIVGDDEFARLSSAPNSTRDDVVSTVTGSVLQSEDINMLLARGQVGTQGVRPRMGPWNPQATAAVPPGRNGHGIGAAGRTFPGPVLVNQAITRLEGIAGRAGGVDNQGSAAQEHASNHSYDDGRTQRWVAEDDQHSEQTTAIESIDLEDSIGGDRPLWNRSRSSFLDRQLPNLEALMG